VNVFSGADMSLIGSFLAGDATFRGGVFVAAADVNADGHADIVTGLGAGGKPQVQVVSGADFSVLASGLVADSGFAGGVRVATVTVGGKPVVAATLGAGGNPQVGLFDPLTLQPAGTIPALDPNFRGGVFVG
jgi:hypothetical protein